MAAKFRKGDRVRVITLYPSDIGQGMQIGQIGTVSVARANDNGCAVVFDGSDFGGKWQRIDGYLMSNGQLELVKDEAAKPEPAKPMPAPISEDDVLMLYRASLLLGHHNRRLACEDVDRIAMKLCQHLPADSRLYLAPSATNPPQEPAA